MKVLKCADMGNASCPAVFKAESADDVLKQAGEHAKSAHNMEATPELVEKIKALITDEPAAPAPAAPAAGAAEKGGQTPPPSST